MLWCWARSELEKHNLSISIDFGRRVDRQTVSLSGWQTNRLLAQLTTHGNYLSGDMMHGRKRTVTPNMPSASDFRVAFPHTNSPHFGVRDLHLISIVVFIFPAAPYKESTKAANTYKTKSDKCFFKKSHCDVTPCAAWYLECLEAPAAHE